MNIAISGKMLAGKTTLAEALRDQYEYEIITIATPIKQLCNLLIENPFGAEKLLLDTLGEGALPVLEELNTAFHTDFRDGVWEKTADGTYLKNEHYRGLTQFVASKMRLAFGESVWCQILLKSLPLQEGSGEKRKYVCDDLRLGVEKKLFEEHGFTVIRLSIDEETQKLRGSKIYGEIPEHQLYHPTEIDLDHATFGLVIPTNECSVEESVSMLTAFLDG